MFFSFEGLPARTSYRSFDFRPSTRDNFSFSKYFPPSVLCWSSSLQKYIFLLFLYFPPFPSLFSFPLPKICFPSPNIYLLFLLRYSSPTEKDISSNNQIVSFSKYFLSSPCPVFFSSKEQKSKIPGPESRINSRTCLGDLVWSLVVFFSRLKNTIRDGGSTAL